MNVKSKVGLRGRILKITPVSVYQERVYTQDILIQFENSVKLRIYDVSRRCEQKDIGKVKNLHVKASIVSPIKKYEIIEPDIAPTTLRDSDPINVNAIISGPLEKIVF